MIEELTLENFKSFRRKQTIRFIQGLNKISGRNAAGKTTVLEAILFALFGDVPNVNKRDLVSLWGGTLTVTLKFRSPLTKQQVTIQRSGSLDKFGKFIGRDLKMDVEGEETPLVREADVDRKVRDLLGVGKRTFFNVVYAKQKEFVEILNPEKGRMDAILGLTTPAEIGEHLKAVKKVLEKEGQIDQKGAFEERLRNASEMQKKEEERIEELKGEVAKLENRLEELGGRLKEREEKLRGIGELVEVFGGIERRYLQLEGLKERLKDREKDLADIYSRIGEAPESRLVEVEERRVKAVELETRLRDLLEKQLEVERRGLDGEIAALKHRINEHAELKETGVAICPKCGQKIDFEKLEDDLKAYKAELEEKNFKLSDLEKEIRIMKQQVDSSRNKRIEAESSRAKLLSEIEQVETLKEAMSTLSEEYKAFQERLSADEETLRKRVETTFERKFISLEEAKTYLEEVRESEQREWAALQGGLKSAEALAEDRRKQRAGAEARLEEYRHLIEATRKALSSIVEFEAKIRAAERMEQRYTEYEKVTREAILKQLGWLTFKYFQRLTDQQLYSNSTIDPENYSLQVYPIGTTRPIPAWRCGGGHESLFALSERLALLRVMNFLHLLILDEPTDAVDSENIPLLLEYIAKSAGEIGQIILVTHHGYGEEEEMNNILVSKVEGESHIRQG